MKDKLIDDCYLLKDNFFDNTETLINQYNHFQYLIKQKGFFLISIEGISAKVYTPELLMFLTSKDLPAFILGTTNWCNINGADYFEMYVNAFNDGEKYFDREFSISTDTLYGKNAEQYVKDIHLNHFHVKHLSNSSMEGWIFVKKYYPNVISQTEIKKYGYYSGIVSKVDALVKKHVKIFAQFDQCEHNQSKEGSDSKENKKIVTYTWTGKPAELIDLHKAMKVGLIDKEAKVKDFCSIFESKDTTKIKPVKWLKTLTDLLLFLHEMMETGLIVDERERMSYKKLQACFLKADGSQFDGKFRSIFEQIKKGYTVQKPVIKELVKQFK